MSAPVAILMAVYSDRSRAEVTIDALKEMGKRGDFEILDAALVEKEVLGKVKIHEVKELTTGKGARRGAIVGGAIGLIFPPSILASAALGAAAGGLVGKLRDTGLKTADLKEAGAELQPGQAGVVAIVEATWVERLTQAMVGHQKLEHLVLEADEAAVIVGDPDTGILAGAAWTTVDEASSDKPASVPPAPDAGTATTPAAGQDA